MVINLWFVRETPAAVLYNRLPDGRYPEPEDQVWVPKSVIIQVDRFPKEPHEVHARHEVHLHEAFVDEHNL
jgi:hypothetical protein